jgi:hypothetical protein
VAYDQNRSRDVAVMDGLLNDGVNRYQTYSDIGMLRSDSRGSGIREKEQRYCKEDE